MSGISKDAVWNSLGKVNRFNIGAQIFRVSSILISHILIVRMISSDEFADFSWIMALTMFFQTLLPVGFDQSFSFFIPRLISAGRVGEVRTLLRFSFKVVFSVSCVAMLMFGVFGSFLLAARGRPDLNYILILMLAANFFFAIAQVNLGAMRAVQEYRESIIGEQILLPGLPLLLIVAGTLIYHSAKAVISAYFVSFLIVAIFTAVRLRSSSKMPAVGEFQKISSEKARS